MEHSEQINELATALAKAQGKMEHANKSKAANPTFKSKYADFAEILDTCREVLSENGLSFVQPVGTLNDKTIEVTTMLMHTSGQWISSTTNLPMVKLDAQAAGSAITYARRYSLVAMLGIAQADDDGEGALGRGKQEKPEAVQAAEKAFNATANPVQNIQYVKVENGIYYLLSKNNGKWGSFEQFSARGPEALNACLNDKDYQLAHKAIHQYLSSRQW